MDEEKFYNSFEKWFKAKKENLKFNKDELNNVLLVYDFLKKNKLDQLINSGFYLENKIELYENNQNDNMGVDLILVFKSSNTLYRLLFECTRLNDEQDDEYVEYVSKKTAYKSQFDIFYRNTDDKKNIFILLSNSLPFGKENREKIIHEEQSKIITLISESSSFSELYEKLTANDLIRYHETWKNDYASEIEKIKNEMNNLQLLTEEEFNKNLTTVSFITQTDTVHQLEVIYEIFKNDKNRNLIKSKIDKYSQEIESNPDYGELPRWEYSFLFNKMRIVYDAIKSSKPGNSNLKIIYGPAGSGKTIQSWLVFLTLKLIYNVDVVYTLTNEKVIERLKESTKLPDKLQKHIFLINKIDRKRHYRYVIVDEFQNIYPHTMVELLKKVENNQLSLLLSGDAQQEINPTRFIRTKNLSSEIEKIFKKMNIEINSSEDKWQNTKKELLHLWKENKDKISLRNEFKNIVKKYFLKNEEEIKDEYNSLDEELNSFFENNLIDYTNVNKIWMIILKYFLKNHYIEEKDINEFQDKKYTVSRKIEISIDAINKYETNTIYTLDFFYRFPRYFYNLIKNVFTDHIKNYQISNKDKLNYLKYGFFLEVCNSAKDLYDKFINLFNDENVAMVASEIIAIRAKKNVKIDKDIPMKYITQKRRKKKERALMLPNKYELHETAVAVYDVMSYDLDYIFIYVPNFIRLRENKNMYEVSDFNLIKRDFKPMAGRAYSIPFGIGIENDQEILNDIFDKWIRNDLYVELTRARKGCFIYFQDEETNKKMMDRVNKFKNELQNNKVHGK